MTLSDPFLPEPQDFLYRFGTRMVNRLAPRLFHLVEQFFRPFLAIW